MNLIFRTVRLENLMTSCRDKLYNHAINNKIKFNFLTISFAKMSSSKSLPLSGTESKIEKMTDRPHTLDATKSKVPAASGRNSVSDLTSSNDVATNGVYGRIGNKTWCKCECCAPMETNIESACCLEIPEISKPRFLSTSCLNVCRSDPHFLL